MQPSCQREMRISQLLSPTNFTSFLISNRNFGIQIDREYKFKNFLLVNPGNRRTGESEMPASITSASRSLCDRSNPFEIAAAGCSAANTVYGFRAAYHRDKLLHTRIIFDKNRIVSEPCRSDRLMGGYLCAVEMALAWFVRVSAGRYR